MTTVTAQRDGLIVVVKNDCPTCQLVAPVLRQLADADEPLSIYVQDEGDLGVGLPAEFAADLTLERSFGLNIEIVPTLIRFSEGKEIDRCYGWVREDWHRVANRDDLGSALPAFRPGCGSKTQDPGMAEKLAVLFGKSRLKSRLVDMGDGEDLIEACMDRGWSDGLPVIPPTQERVLRMLAGTDRSPDEVLGMMPPDLATCTVEKVAVNAVMAGCKPEYLPVVIAAVEAVLEDAFAMHGVLCTTHFCGPMLVVNGPIARAIGMNSGVNAMGQGNRANASIGRALQLIVRNVGGGRPGEIDRSTMGFSGKYGFCFAEAETDGWEPLAQQRGVKPGASGITVFAAAGMQGMVDQKSRDAESLARSFASSLRVVDHAKLAGMADAVIVVSPEHARTFIKDGWSKAKLAERLHELLQVDGAELAPGVGGIAEGLPNLAGKRIHKFRPGGLLIVRAGGTAGMFSAIIPSWPATGVRGSDPVTKEILL